MIKPLSHIRSTLMQACALLAGLLMLLSLAVSVSEAAKCRIDLGLPKVVRVGFITDGSTPGDKALVERYKEQIRATVEPELKAIFSDEWTLSGNDSRSGVRAALDRLLQGPAPDVIFALGLVSASEAAGRRSLSKPVIAPIAARFSVKGGKGRMSKNFVWVDQVYYLDRDLDTFQKIAPFKRCVVLLDQREVEGLDGVYSVVKGFGKSRGLEIYLIPVGSSVEEAVRQIPEGTQAAFIGPLWHMSGDQLAQLASRLIEKKIAPFSIWDAKQVERGLLAGLEPRDKGEILARRAAITLMDIIHGQRPASVEVDFVRSRDLVINMESARRLGIYPNLLMLTQAEVIDEEPAASRGARRLDIKQAVEEAVEANLRLESARVNVKAGEHAVKEKMADLLPRIDLGTGYRGMDQDRAKTSGGVTPERAWTGSASGSILLYSESKWANFTAEEHLQLARQMHRERVRLDVTYDAAVAYLNVLRAKTIERIYKENLALTKANLERARIKVETGAAGPDEVYRWESKFANDRREVLYRESDTMSAMEALNRVLHRPLTERFVPEEATLKDPLFHMGDKFYFGLMENPLLLERFKRFAAKEAVALRPELKGFDAAIKAKERLAVAARREVWLPDFTVEWSVDHYFTQDGDGRRDGTPLDDTDWGVGVFARIPLFEGGKTVARAGRLEQELSKLQIDRSAVAEAIIQEVLAAINTTRASYPSITLTRQAADTAKKNLDLVTDSYLHGIKSIIDLLDAQNQYLNAELNAANAVYNFLIDFMGVQRALGEFIIFMPEGQRQEWMKRASAEIGMK